jgi:hypothetical protein
MGGLFASIPFPLTTRDKFCGKFRNSPVSSCLRFLKRRGMLRRLWWVIGLLVFVLHAPSSQAAEFLGWQDTGGKAITISIGVDGTVWVLSFNRVGTAGDYGLHRWNPQARTWKSHPIGGGVALAVAPDGFPAVVTSTTQVFLSLTSDGHSAWDRFRKNMRDFLSWIRGKTGG